MTEAAQDRARIVFDYQTAAKRAVSMRVLEKRIRKRPPGVQINQMCGSDLVVFIWQEQGQARSYIPKRIKHWIEPEQHLGKRSDFCSRQASVRYRK
jgi:hypothetical protein